ncbi:hypothetical protein BH24BAC1_BH24BAC1_12580 [soil metagenome]
MKTLKRIIPLFLAGSLLLACNRPTESVETDTTGTTPVSDQELDRMANERERQTKQALQRQQDTLQRGDTAVVR